eukprot:GHVS01076263.1.p1 GENE.GHVS01076263.1~~GHVS01076263.1.p1  ORF type:complete len:506 (+),score=67.82 GHVS01076263.1:141-1658(+)
MGEGGGSTPKDAGSRNAILSGRASEDTSSMEKLPSSSLWTTSCSFSGLLVLLVCSLGLRIILFAANLSSVLLTTVPSSLSSPIFSHESILEAFALLRSNLSAYSGDVCHVPPLLLAFWNPVEGPAGSTHYFALLLWQEVVIALFIFDTARWWRRGNRWNVPSGDVFVAGCYLLNPFTIASDLTLSIHSIRLLLLSGLIYFTCRSSPNILPPSPDPYSSPSSSSSASSSSSSSSSLSFWKFLAILFYSLLLYLAPLDFVGLGLPLSLIFVATRPPAAVGGQAERPKNELGDGGDEEVVVCWWKWARACVALYASVAVAVGLLHLASYCVNNYDWGYLDSCVVAVVEHRDLSPNLGPHWYLFQMLFKRYETLFFWILQAHHLMYVLPLCLVLKNKPLALLHTLIAIALLFQPYATVSDGCFIACLILTHHDMVEEMAFIKSLIISFVAMVLYFTMECLWLSRNTANANFLYSIQITFTVATGIFIIDFIRTNIRSLDKQEGTVDGSR